MNYMGRVYVPDLTEEQLAKMEIKLKVDGDVGKALEFSKLLK